MKNQKSNTSQVNLLVRCADCKYWDNSKAYICSDIEKNYGICNNDAFAYEEIDDGRTDMLIYADYEGYSAGFDTGKDFGCIHAEKRI